MSEPLKLNLPGLAGQRVVITAGANGIGLAIARELHNQGARLALCDVDAKALELASAELGGCMTRVTDVSDEGAVETFFQEVKSELGGLDALINNAGTAGPTGNVEDITVKSWRRCIDICLTGQFICAHNAVPMLKATGGGSIVNMSSVAGKHGYAYRTPYSAAKFGVIGLTQSLAKELGSDNIRVNAILPGVVSGPRMESVISARAKTTGVSYDEMEQDYLSKISLRRMVTMEDVATMTAFLLSNAGANLSGQSLAVDANVETL